MRKLLFSVCFALLISNIAKAQIGYSRRNSSKQPAVYISFCGAVKDRNTLKYADVLKCKKITLSSANYTVKSFGVTAMVRPDNDKEAPAIYIAAANTGCNLSDESIDLIKRLINQNGKKLIIEDIMLLEPDGKTIKKINGLEINVEP